MDGVVAHRVHDVFRLHVRRPDVAAAKHDRGTARMDPRRIRHVRQFGVHTQRLRISDPRRHHPRQDGRAVHRPTVGFADVHRRLSEILRRERLVRGFGHRNVARFVVDLVPRLGQTGVAGLYDLRLRHGDGRYHRIKSHSQVVRRQGDGSGHGT